MIFPLHKTVRRRVVIALMTVAMAAQTFAAGPPQSGSGQLELNIDTIMRGPSLVGYEPRNIRWAPDGQHIYFSWKRASDSATADFDTYSVNRDGSGLIKLSEEEARNVPPAGADSTKDRKLTAFTRDGDVYVLDSQTGKTRRITETEEPEFNAHVTENGSAVYFTRGENLYLMSLGAGSIAQLTDIKPAGYKPEPPRRGFGEVEGPQIGLPIAEKSKSESQEQRRKEQSDLFDVIRAQEEKERADEAKRNREHPRKPLVLGHGERVRSLLLAPNEKYVLVSTGQADDGSRSTIVPNFVTESGYTEAIPGRTKVGDIQSGSRLAVVDVKTGEAQWVDKNLQLPGIATGGGSHSGEGKEKSDKSESGKAGRTVQLFQPVWSDDGTKLVVMARSDDNKDRWILAVDPSNGKSRIIEHDHDDAWIDGPGAYTLGWLPDNQHIYFQSERTGYAHLYTADFETGEAKALTSGNWEVTNVSISADKTHFLVVTSETAPGERHLYSMAFTGGERTQLTKEPGLTFAQESPDGGMLALVYSAPNRPPELYVEGSQPGAEPYKVTSSPAPEFWSYKWTEPPIVTFKARDGATVYGRVYKPANYKGGPAVIFTHGAGYLQDVDRWWSSYYYREYMFHHFLMEHGYLVFEIDYRASAGYGRDWRTGIYEFMGGKDLSDHVDAARWIVSQYGVDPNRIGIYGGSYGGFMTLMAMFTAPGTFAAGAALRPVTNWSNYNHGYTSDILNTPQTDKEAYRKSSPIFFAAGLKGALLICHGMADTNVHFQDTVELVQRLIELRKQNWELAVYPVESHGFVEPTSWADEYKRIFKLFEENLKPKEGSVASANAGETEGHASKHRH